MIKDIKDIKETEKDDDVITDSDCSDAVTAVKKKMLM